MPPRLCRNLRPFVLSYKTQCTGIRWSSSTIRQHEPLRVLFCGADEFSIYSLRALRKFQESHPEKIASIDVVCRPDKRVGRGLKKVQEVPIKPIAQSLSIPIHQIDTFRSWSPPTPYAPNLVVTVSFGLLVPARILNSATYGGLNVHPSLLPDLRGPAPLQHALLNRRTHTGVSLQTMHPTKFDHGVVLAQTEAPGVQILADATPQSLLETLGPIGADMLVRGIEDGVFVPPPRDVREHMPQPSEADLAHAPKVTPSDRKIEWQTWDAEEIALRDRALGRLWNDMDSASSPSSRVSFTGPWRIEAETLPSNIDAGQVFVASSTTGEKEVRIATRDGQAVVPAGITLSGGKKNQGGTALLAQLEKQAVVFT